MVNFFLCLLFALLTPFPLPDLHAETPTFQSDHTNARNILNLARTNQSQQAAEQVDPSLADTVRSMDPASQRTFAYLFNEKGVRLANEEKISDALPCLHLAVEFHPEQKVYQKNLSQALIGAGQERYLSGDFSGAEKNLGMALQYDPNNAGAMIALSDVYYYSQQTLKAKDLLLKARKLSSDSAEIEKRLERITGDEQLEKGMKLAETEIFDIKFNKETSASYNIYDLKQTLRKAFREIGQNLHYYPRHTIAVILYAEDDYRKLRQIPEWSSGAYDGKIRIPIPSNGNIENSRLKQIIWHEYTHAVIRDITAGNCPIWLNEGLADYHGYLFAKFDPALLRETYLAGKLFSLKQLSEEFRTLTDTEKIRLAYAQSYSFVGFIIDRWGFYKLRHLLEASERKLTVEDLIQSELNTRADKFEAEWFKYLKKTL
jgi:tetratricopeptide (TPR) repeat protein